jgi:hypothetical protein
MLRASWSRRRTAFVTVMALLLATPLAVSHAAGPRPATPVQPEAAGPTPIEVLHMAATRAPDAKIDAALKKELKSDKVAKTEIIVVTSAEALDLSSFGTVLRTWTWPAGEHVTMVRMPVKGVSNLAALPGVATVESGDPYMKRPLPDRGPDPEATHKFEALKGDALKQMQAKLKNAPAWSADAKAPSSHGVAPAAAGTTGVAPLGWHDVGPGHAASEAWSMGYQGQGVRVAVLDTSVDFGHPDLQGTWAVNPPDSTNAGWPEIYDPYSMYLHVVQLTDREAPTFSAIAQGGFISMTNQADVVQNTVNGKTVNNACIAPFMATYNPNTGGYDGSVDTEDCSYIVPASKSGVVKYGYHPDTYLVPLGKKPDRDGEFATVLLVDANVAGVYDTVYVDLNYNRDFTDEKPVTKASPLSVRDIDGDGISDLSGGLMYFLADGKTSIPGSYLWEDAQHKLPIPEAGSLIAVMYDVGGHGTLCSSNIVSQGRLGVPPGTNFSFRNQEKDPALNANGQPESVNPGMAPKASLVGVGDVYSGPELVMQSAWRYAVWGTDMAVKDDDIQVASDSYGYSSTDNDTWDLGSRYVDHYVRTYNPTISFLWASGNGGSGYGTITPQKPTVAMGVAASTQFGSTGWDSMYETSQITYGDIVAFSDRGPTANGKNGVKVAADGAFSAGGDPINSVTMNQSAPEGRRSGAYSNTTWGGTSRSCPVASGLLALAYQAFKQANNRWPNWDEAQAIFMAGARFAGYDTTVMGAGVADAGDAARIASGTHGVYAMPSLWAAGDYHGKVSPAFTNVMNPGAASTGTFTLKNPSDHPIDVTLHGQTMQRIGSYEDDFNSLAIAQETTPYSMQAPDYLKAMDKTKIPAGTELMVVRAVLPYSEFDVNGNFTANDTTDNYWRVGVYQHTDWNDDGKLWVDKNNNGVVNHSFVSPVQWVGLDGQGGNLSMIDYPNSEIQQGEYGRFNYSYPTANSWQVTVHNPLERWKDGIYIALWHRQIGCNYNTNTCQGGRPATVPTSHLKMRVDFYKYQDWPWLKLSKDTVSVPAKSEATFDATMTVGADSATGFYQGAIFADYARGMGDKPVPTGGGYELPQKRVTIPVTVNVAAQYNWQGAVTLGGAKADDPAAPYSNGSVRGMQDWTWRPESGDWRFFFADATKPDSDTFWLTRTTWQDNVAGRSDIDTRFYGPTKDPFTNPDDPANKGGEKYVDNEWYGPYTMGLLNQSPYLVRSPNVWPFNTSSGKNEDWQASPAAEGLHEVMLDNVLFSGSQIEMPFETTLSSIRMSPSQVTLYGNECSNVSFTSQMPLPGFQAGGYGLTKPQIWKDQSIGQDNPNDLTSASFQQVIDVPSTAARFDIAMTGETGTDLDLYLLYDFNGDGALTTNEVVAQSAGNTANESISLGGLPPKGKYGIWVMGYSVPSGTTKFTLTADVIYGAGMLVKDAPTDVEAGKTYTFRLCADPSAVGSEEGPLSGVVVFGPGGAPTLLRVNATWIKTPPQKMIYLPFSAKGYDFRPEASITMNAVGDGPSGTATLTDVGDGLRVTVDLPMASTDTTHPGHIHTGSCAVGGPVYQPLSPVENGKSVTLLKGVRLSDVQDGTKYINIHKSDADLATIISCGDIPMPTP